MLFLVDDFKARVVRPPLLPTIPMSTRLARPAFNILRNTRISPQLPIAPRFFTTSSPKMTVHIFATYVPRAPPRAPAPTFPSPCPAPS